MNRPRMTNAAKRAYGTRFGLQAELYDEMRPGYPPAVVNEIVSLSGGGLICDLGAGTGKLSAALLERRAHVLAVDPDPQLLDLNPAEGLRGTAESIPLPDESAAVVVAAQAWHWFDEGLAAREIHRVLKPRGVLVILINQLDVRVDWVMRLSRIMHAGDVYRPEWKPSLPGFEDVTVGVQSFQTSMTRDSTVALAATRTYWLRSDDRIRRRVEGNIRDYLTNEHVVEEPFDLPYLCLWAQARRVSAR